MLTYIMAFIFYTFAMIGVMLLGFVIYKKTMMLSKAENKGMIKILDKIMISPKKSLLIVKVKNERFLIAADSEHTTFLSKLTEEKQIYKEQNQESIPRAQMQEKEIFVDEIQKQRLDNIQKQFSELYSDNKNENKSEKNVVATDRREMIRKLLKELNNTTGNIKTGSY